jgi:hypothetical protein
MDSVAAELSFHQRHECQSQSALACWGPQFTMVRAQNDNRHECLGRACIYNVINQMAVYEERVNLHASESDEFPPTLSPPSLPTCAATLRMEE